MQLPKDDKGFDQFPTLQNGWSALNRQVKKDALPERKHTVDTFIEKYAPASDNNKHKNYVNYFVENVNNAARELGKVIKFTADTPLKTIVDTIGEKEVSKIISKKEDIKTYKKLEQANFFETKPVVKPTVPAKRDLSFIPTKKVTKSIKETTTDKVVDYINKAPWSEPSKLITYFSTVYDTKQRSEGKNLKEETKVKTPVVNITNKDKVKLGSSYKDSNGLVYGKSVVDMSNGIYVTYQPRNEKSKNRKDINNAIMISDYLYDMDFTDNTNHEHAQNSLNKLKSGKTTQKFVQVREPSKTKGEYIVKIKKVSDLTENDFKNNNIYRQSYAKLSDLDITPDGKKIKLTNYAKKWNVALFVNQGLPFHEAVGSEHNLRLPGGKGNYGKYQNISELKQFGPYLGGTVTIISDDGKIVKKVTGGVGDIVEEAQRIKKQTDGKEVYFLQSDAGSMNVKAFAKNNKLTKDQLGILRNLEPQAGAAEILLNK
jgi:hypothetical protein